MPPYLSTILYLVGFLLIFIISYILNKYGSQVSHLFSFIPKRLISLFFDAVTLLIVFGFIVSIPGIINRLYNLDKLRHTITDKRHPITQNDIFQALQFNYKESHLSKEAILDSLNSYLGSLDSVSHHSLDSLIIELDKNPTYNTSFGVYHLVCDNDLPVSIREYYLSNTLKLANKKYETIWPVLYSYAIKKDCDKVLSIYNLVDSWKWDRNLFDERIKTDTHELDRNYTMSLCMFYAIRLLEETSETVTDSVARVIFDCAKKGHNSGGTNYINNPIYFLDKRAEYAYRLKDRKADKYADILIQSVQRSGFFSKRYHYLFYDRGGDIYGYEDRFFTDPIFLRYKSLIKKKRYMKARDLLEVVSSITGDDDQDPENPYHEFHDTLFYYNRQFQDRIRKYSQYDLASISENARIRFLTHRKDVGEWLNGAYLTGAKYLSPTEGHQSNTIDYLFNEELIHVPEISSYIAVNYNNADPRWVYNTALFLKGASGNFTGSIYKAIRETEDQTIINDLQAIKREHVFSSSLNTEDERYVALNDSIETRLASNMRDHLSDCFYGYLDIKNSLSDNECAIEIVKAPSLSFGDDEYKAVILRHDWTEPIIISLANNSSINKSLISGNYYSSKSELYSTVWKPLEEYLSQKDVVYLASDGALSLINLSALVNDNGQRLSDLYEFHQCVSTKSVMDKDDSEQYSSIALFGGINYDDKAVNESTSLSQEVIAYRSADNSFRDNQFEYLAGTGKEISEINAEANENLIPSILYEGENGTEYNFKDLTGKDISIIHVATHGFYYNAPSTRDLTFFEKISVKDNPLNRCGLIFSGGNRAWKGEVIPDNQEDGILLGSEIARMDLSGTDLVVLSACNTGLGEISEEGVVGLQMAFKRAGVKSLLLTLSKVDDEATSFFMTNFYEHLFSGEDKHSAYKAAINTMRNSEKYSDPKYWSSFILVD